MAALGSIFLKTALAPLHFANVSIMGRIVTTGLREIAAENLRNELRSAIRKVAVAAAVRPLDIQRLLPMSQLETVAAQIDASQKAAVAAWRDQPVASRRARDLASLTMGGGMPNMHESLARMARQEGSDTPLGESLLALADAIRQWQELLLQSGALLDAERVLEGAFRRRALRRILMLLVVLAGAGVGVFFWQRIEQARARVNAKIGSGDPCAVLGIDAADLKQARAEQLAQIEQRKATCEEQRAKEERAAQEREKRAAYERACADAAEALDKGAAPSNDVAIDKKHAPLLSRIAKRELAEEDLGPKPPDFPCRDVDSAPRFDAAFAKAVLASKLWLKGGTLSEPVRGIIAKGAKDLPDELKAELDDSAEQLAARAIIDKLPWQVERAKNLCSLKTTLGLSRGAFCRGL